MKKDINFLESSKLGEQKKNSNAMTAVMIVVVVAILSVMAFMFVKMKTTYSANEKLMQELEQEKTSGKYAKNEQAYLAAMKKLEDYLAVTDSKNALDTYINSFGELTGNIVGAIFDSAADDTNVQVILIKSFEFNNQSLSLGCKTLVPEPEMKNLMSIIEAFKTRLTSIKVLTEDGFVDAVKACTYPDDSLVTDKDADGNYYIEFNMLITFDDRAI